MLGRVKRVLQLERGASARREKEMEEIRNAHTREVTALQEACRRAEQVRRDAVGRCRPNLVVNDAKLSGPRTHDMVSCSA